MLGDVDVPGDGHALTGHALLLHQGGGGETGAGFLEKGFKIFMAKIFLIL